MINGKVYIGKHSTDDLDDGYMGSGKLITQAIAKYGLENFRKSILQQFETEDAAYAFEAQVVNEQFLQGRNCYNVAVGGLNGLNFSGEVVKEWRRKGGSTRAKKLWADPNYRIQKIELARKEMLEQWSCGDRTPTPEFTFSNRHHTELSKQAIGKANSLHQHGAGNSQFGTIWIHNDVQQISRKIPKIDLQEWIDIGWLKGRKMKWPST